MFCHTSRAGGCCHFLMSLRAPVKAQHLVFSFCCSTEINYLFLQMARCVPYLWIMSVTDGFLAVNIHLLNRWNLWKRWTKAALDWVRCSKQYAQEMGAISFFCFPSRGLVEPLPHILVSGFLKILFAVALLLWYL